MKPKRYLLAKQLNEQGYNCSQAILCAYADIMDMDIKTAFRLAEGFGGGMGRMQGTCGILTGVYMLIGNLSSDGNLDKGVSKKDTYAKIRTLHDEFVERLGSENCKELLKGQAPAHLICLDKIEIGCEIVENMLHQMNIDIPTI